jgi:hypothetical protein
MIRISVICPNCQRPRTGWGRPGHPTVEPHICYACEMLAEFGAEFLAAKGVVDPRI